MDFKKIAVGGKRTDWMLDQVKNEYEADKKYDVVTVWGGVNDVYSLVSLDRMKSNLQGIYDLAKKNGAKKVIAVTVIPTKTYNKANDNYLKRTKDLNDWIRSNKTLDDVIDAESILNDGNDGTKKDFLMNDTLHINKTGQTELKNNFIKQIIK